MHYRYYDSIEDLGFFFGSLREIGHYYIFQDFHWLRIWYKTVGVVQKDLPFIITVSKCEGEMPFLIVPLMINVRNGFRYLMSLGGAHADFGGVVIGDMPASYSSRELMDRIFYYAKKNRVDIIRIRRIPKVIDGVLNPLFCGECVVRETNYFINLDRRWEDYYDVQLKSKFKADIKRREKLLAKQGAIKFMVAQSKADKERLTAEMIRLKSDRYESKQQNNQFDRQENRDLYLEVTKNMSGDIPHLSALLLDEKVIAVHWGLVHKGRIYHVMPAHDQSLAKYAPGKILLKNLVKWAFDNDMRYFDFTCGDEDYKKDWAEIEALLYEYKRAVSLKGMAYIFTTGWLGLLKSMIKQIRSKNKIESLG